jgi:hypothetical protein
VKRDHIYDVLLFKVLYNGNDITELVKERGVIMKDPGTGG